MSPIQWNTIVANMSITARPTGLWTPVFEYLPAGTVLRVLASGKWCYSGQMAPCGPDGDRVSFISSQNCLTKDALVGSLICKVGGGTADLKGAIFAGGSCTLFTVPADGGGGLFMSINDEIAGFDDNAGQLTVSVDVRLTMTITKPS